MARNKVDDCMFCGNNPCDCNKPSKPERAQKIPRATKPTVVVELPAEAVAPAIKSVRPPARVPNRVPLCKREPAQRVQPKTPTVKQFRTEDEKEWRRALTVIALSGLIGEDELTKHRDSFDLPSWKIDALIWKSQHANHST